MIRRLHLLALATLLATASAWAGPLGEDLTRDCRSRGVPADACAVILAGEDALARPGLTVGDFSADGEQIEIEIADFSFRPRLSVIRDGQTIVFRNSNPDGGNRHSLASADLGSDDPVLPLPGASFGGGRAFRSGVLDPGATFTLTVDIATMDPAAWMPLPTGDHLIGFFCYIHGASQMSGQLLVTGAP